MTAIRGLAMDGNNGIRNRFTPIRRAIGTTARIRRAMETVVSIKPSTETAMPDHRQIRASATWCWICTTSSP